MNKYNMCWTTRADISMFLMLPSQKCINKADCFFVLFCFFLDQNVFSASPEDVQSDFKWWWRVKGFILNFFFYSNKVMENVISLIYYSAAQTFSHSWKFMHLGETVWILFFIIIVISGRIRHHRPQKLLRKVLFFQTFTLTVNQVTTWKKKEEKKKNLSALSLAAACRAS